MTRAKHRRILLLTAAACLIAVALPAEGAGEMRPLRELWNDPTVFLPEFFPEAEKLSPEDLLIEGLKSRFPNRIYREKPSLSPGPSREPRVESLMPGVAYVRVYHLGAALPVLREEIQHQTLVIDLRNVQAERDDVLAFGSVVTVNKTVRISLTEHYGVENSGTEERDLAIEAAGLRRPVQPVFVLSNGETAGPLEALLAELKNKGQIISIGTPTTGKTGQFEPIGAPPSLYVLNGEILPSSGESLLEKGFVPSVTIDVSPERDQKTYRALEEGESLQTLIASELPEQEESGRDGLSELLEDNGETETEREVVDAVLQRAYHIVAALRSIGKIASPGPG